MAVLTGMHFRGSDVRAAHERLEILSVIDIEALAVPAFLVGVLASGVPVAMRFNAAARDRSELARCLVSLLRPHRQGGEADFGKLAAALQVCTVERTTVEAALVAVEQEERAVWMASLAPLAGQDGPVTMLLGICRPSAPQERDAAGNGSRLSLALQAIHGAEWCYDVRRNVYQGSDEIATLLGERWPRPVSWAEWLERVHAQDLGLFLAPPSPQGFVEFRFHASGGELRWARCSRVAVLGDDGEAEVVLGVMVDITLERARETALADLVIHDALTGLFNRRGLRQEMERLQAELSATSYLVLLAVDLDRFKSVNDTNGHAAGDAVLVEAARRLGAASEGGVCARVGGDEFIVALHLASESEAHRLRDRLCQEFRRPMAFRGRWLPVSASVGVACMSGIVDVARLLDAADADLYAQKHAQSRPASAAA